jgi:hypothetical protein
MGIVKMTGCDAVSREKARFAIIAVMNELLLALLLSTDPTAASLCCPPPAQRFAAQTDGAKEVRDNIAHFVVPAAVSTASFGLALELGASRKEARWIAAGTSVLLIVAKEIYDEAVASRFGLEEVAIGVGGTAAGLLLAEQLIWQDDEQP